MHYPLWYNNRNEKGEKYMLRLMTHNVWNRDENLPAWEEMGEDCSAANRAKGAISE